MNKQEILNRLDIPNFYQSFIPSLKVNGKQEALGLCPFHDDHNPSLSVNIESGQYFCHVCNDGGDLFKFYMRLRNLSFKDALTALSNYSGEYPDKEKCTRKIECVYPYTDENGKVLFEVVRYIPKTFRQRLPDGKGGYIYNLDSVKIVPYNLPNVIASDTVYICEGEKDCDNLAKLALTAATNPGGAGKWRDDFNQYFAGKDVVVLCDNDEAGKKHGLDVAKKLNGSAKSIKLIEQLPGVPLKGDVSDWLKLNPYTPENQKIRLLEIIKNVSVWTPKECDKHNSTMILTRLDSLFKEPEESTTWLVDRLLPSGGFSALVAKPKVGKTTGAENLALHIASGKPFLGRDVNQGVVIYLALEEKRSEVKKHFQDMGANGNEEIHIYTGGTPTDAIKQIRHAVESLKPSLLIIDPLFRLAKVKDGNDYIQVTNALDPLLRIARELKTHVLVVHHSPKGQRDGGDSVLGSQAIFGSVDTLLIMKRHEGYRTIQSIQRYGEDLPETILNFDKNTRTVTIGNAREVEDLARVKQEILTFLGSQNEPATEPVIVKETEGNTALKRKALRELVSSEEVKREGKGGRGDPFRYSRILVPDIYVKQEYEHPKSTGNPHGCEPYSRTDNFTKTDSRTEDFVDAGNEKNEVITIEDFEVVEVSE